LGAPRGTTTGNRNGNKISLWGWQVAHYSMIKVAPYLLIKHS